MAESEFNGVFSTKNFGSYKVRIDQIQYGLDIIASQGESGVRQAFYPVAYDGSSWSMVLLFTDYADREKFNDWLRTYMEKVVQGHGFYASMTVNCPVRNFTRVGIPQDQIDYGEGITDVGYKVSLNFLGVTDPTDPNKSVLNSGISYFQWPKKDKTTRYFYPASKQLAGAADLAGTIFDPTPDATATTNATVAEEQSGFSDTSPGTQ